MNLKTIKKSQLKMNNSFWNQTFDKSRLKNFVLWFLLKHGEYKTVKLVEELKTLGFQYATKAGISLGIEDLMIPKRKNILIMEAEKLSINTIKEYKRNEITGVERFQRLIDTWHRTSERLKQEVIENFEATDILNPVYMMAFSGARGNISQVRQLVGMRGLMSNPQGQIIDFPIRSNFREGLTLTEYIISSYGARKGIVDTALRTANAGYLTRRLVDVAQHVIISNFDCGTKRGIFLTDMKEGNKIIYSLQNRLVGRVLARDIFNQHKIKIASRNTEISSDLSTILATTCKKVFVRSSLTCQTKNLVCQLCYGWSLAQGNLVGIGEAVGVVAAQSIGEPGTQLTMRTFHTGGVFSGDVSDQIKAPYDGVVIYDNPIAGTLIRTPEGKIAFLTKNEGSVSIFSNLLPETYYPNSSLLESNNISQKNVKKFKIPFYTLLFFKNGEKVLEKEVIAQISSINRQKNATDQAEFTIHAELSGQFFSKLLNLKENKVGPKLKAGKLKIETSKKIPTPSGSPARRAYMFSTKLKDNADSAGPEIIIEQFNEDIVDTIYEAWGWGYAWVLSGKIYQLPQTSNFFPIVGDFVNNKTYMNKNKLTLNSSFGNSFKLSVPLKKSFFNNKIIKKLRISKDISNILEYNQNQLYKPITKKDVTFLKTELISLKLSKIIYKKFGYFIKLTKPTFFVPQKLEKTKVPNNINNLNLPFKNAILSEDDTIFLLSSLDKKLLETNGSEDINIHNEKESYRDKNSFIYPSKWVSSFDVFLNWFPKRFYTKTGGLIFMEPIFFNTEFDSTYRIKENKVILSKIAENQMNKLLTIENIPNQLYNSDSDYQLTNIYPGEPTYSIFDNQRWGLHGQLGLEGSAAARPEGTPSKIMQAGFGQDIQVQKQIIKKYFKNKKIKNLLSIYIDKIIDFDFQENYLFINQIYLTKNELQNQASYKVDKKNIYFFPTFIKRNLLKNKIKQVITKNKENLIDKQSLLNNDLVNNYLIKPLIKDYSKNLIFEQYQSKEIGTLIIGPDKQSPSLSKNKKPSTLLTYGLNWKNNYKLNFNKFSFSSLNKINLLGHSAVWPKMTMQGPNSEQELSIENFRDILRNEKLENKHLQRIFYVPESFYKFSLKKLVIQKSINIKNLINKNDILNPRTCIIKDNAARPEGTLSKMMQAGTGLSKNKFINAKHIGEVFCSNDFKGRAIIQLNRQAKFKKYYLEDGYLNSHTSDFFKLKTHTSSGPPWSGPTILDSNYLDSEILQKTFSPIQKLDKLLKFKKLNIYSKFDYNTIFQKDFIFYKNSFIKNVENKVSKITQLNDLCPPGRAGHVSFDNRRYGRAGHGGQLYSQPNKKKVIDRETLSNFTLKTFSKMMSFPYFLNKKSSNILNKNFITLSNNFFSKNKLSTNSKTDKELINRKKENKKINNISLFNYHFYSYFNKNKKKQILLNDKNTKQSFLKKNVLTAPALSSIIKDNQRLCRQPHGRCRPCWQVQKNKKINEICSPYLKNQLKYSFYLFIPRMNKKTNRENNNFFRILNINNFLSNSSLGFTTQMLFYKKGFFYLGFFEQSKKSTIDIKTEVQKNKKLKFSNMILKEESFNKPMAMEFLTLNLDQKLIYFNFFSINQRIKTFQIWLKKAFFSKNIFLKNYKKVSYSLINSLTSADTGNFEYASTLLDVPSRMLGGHQVATKWIHTPVEYTSSSSRAYPSFGFKTLDEKSLVNQIIDKKKYKIYSQSKTKDYLNIKKLSSLINLSVKPGWYYFTKNLSKFFLYNRNFIHPGKIVAEDFIFDHEPIYLEVIPLGEEFDYIKAQNSKIFNSENETHDIKYVSNFDKLVPELSVSTTKMEFLIRKDQQDGNNIPSFLKQSNIKINRFTKIIKNNKCRFEPDNLKEIFKSKKNKISKNPLTGTSMIGNDHACTTGCMVASDHAAGIKNNKSNKGFFILIRKASEYKLHKDFELKNDLLKLSNQTALNNSQISIFEKTNFFSTKNYNEYSWTSKTPLKIYNFSKFLKKRKVQSIYLDNGSGATYTIDSNYEARSMKISESRIVQKECFAIALKNIFTAFPQTEKIIITPPLSFNFVENMEARRVGVPIMQPEKPIRIKVQEQSFSFEIINFEYAKENFIHLYNQFKTPFINKQKIASQILSKYPSSDLKIFSKKPFYSSLLTFKNKLFNAFQSELVNLTFKNDKKNLDSTISITGTCIIKDNAARPEGTPSKIMQAGTDNQTSNKFLLEKNIKSVKLIKKISLSINKLNSWGIPLMPITAKGSINLLPFIISYKAPYSIEFPFKFPIRLFCQQNNFNYNSFNKNFEVDYDFKVNSSRKNNNLWGSELPKAVIEQSIKSTSMDNFKKILNNYRLKIKKLRDLKNINNVISCNNINSVLENMKLDKKACLTKKKLFELNKQNKIKSSFSTIFFCPIAEYSLGKNIDKSILYPNNIISTYPIQNTRLFISNQNFIYNKKFFSRKYKEKISFISSKLGPAWPTSTIQGSGCIIKDNAAGYLKYVNGKVEKVIKSMPFVLGSLNNFLDFSPKYKINKEVFLYKTEFESFLGNKISPLLPFINSYNYCCFEGELIFKSLKYFKKETKNSQINHIKNKNLISFSTVIAEKENLKNKTNQINLNNKKKIKNLNMDYYKVEKKNKIKNLDQENLEHDLFSNKRLGDSCIILTKKDQLSFYLDSTFSFIFNKFSKNISIDLTSSTPLEKENNSVDSSNIKFLKEPARPEGTPSKIMQPVIPVGSKLSIPRIQQQKFKLSLDLNYKQIYQSLEDFKKKNRYLINETIIKFLNVTDKNSDLSNSDFGVSDSKVAASSKIMQAVIKVNQTSCIIKDNTADENADRGTKKVSDEIFKTNIVNGIEDKNFNIPNTLNEINSKKNNKEKNISMNFYKINKLPIGTSHQKNKLLLGEFLVYGDQISPSLSVTKAGQIIHINNKKVTLRHGQPIFVSPKAILHKYDTDFIEEQSPVITLSYQQLKTGDIIQGIPKVEQFFEARTTKRGRLFRDSLKNLLKGLFRRYSSKGQPSDQAVRQSFYKIQQIIVDGVQRVYRSQGVSIADKHLEVIVKQMTSKVRILEGGQTGFFPGEIVDLNFIEQVNSLLMRKITYEPLVLGITKASLEVDSFLSAASFQQTTRVLSNAALSRKKDFLKGLKENVILGNLIPAGTGYLVYLD